MRSNNLSDIFCTEYFVAVEEAVDEWDDLAESLLSDRVISKLVLIRKYYVRT